MKTQNSSAQDGVDVDQRKSATWSRPRTLAFYSVIAVLLIGINGAFWRVNLFPLLAWLPDDLLNSFYLPQLEFDGISVGDFSQHRIHYLAISASHWGSALIPLFLLLRNPMTKVAPMWQLTGGLLVGTLTYPFGDVSRIPPPVFVVITLAVVAGLLHPANIFRTAPRVGDKTMAAMCAVAAIPLIALVVSNVQLQGSSSSADPHGQGLHYQFMAEFGLVSLLLLLLGASSLSGWRYSVWSASFMIGLMGVGFIVYQDHSGSGGFAWGIAMVVWAASYLIRAEGRARKDQVAERATIDEASQGFVDKRGDIHETA